jgi:hypothetical protein
MMRFSIAGLAGVAAGAMACGAVAQDWVSLGPAPIREPGPLNWTGRVSAVACSRTEAGVYYVGGADAGVWRSTDAGASWTALSDAWPTTAVGCITLDPTDERTIYVGTGEANFANHSRYGLGIMKSTDGGGSWMPLAEATFAGRCISAIVVDPAARATVYASVTRAGGFPEMSGAKGHPQRTGPVGLFKSPDAGVTWSRLEGLPDLAVTSLVMDPVNSQTLYAAVGHIFGNPLNGIYKSTDAGVSWTRLTSGLPTVALGRISLAISPTNPQRLFALMCRACDATGGGGNSLGAFTTTNAGASWTSVGSVDQNTYGWYLSVVSVNPANANQAFCGGLQLMRFTVPGGSATVTPPHVDLHALAWDAAGRLIAGDDGGLHRTANLGSSWQHLNSGVGTIQFYAGVSSSPGAAAFALGGAQDNGSSMLFGPGPADWEQVIGGDGGWTQFAGTFPTPSVMFAESQGTGALVRSTDGGNTFLGFGAGLAGRNCFLPPYLIDPHNPSRVLYGTERVWERIGTGAWTAISPDLTDGAGAIRALAVAPSDSQYVYAATNDGNIQRSSDSGHTFTLIRDNVPGWPRVTREIFVSPVNPQDVWLAVAQFGTARILRSTDAGATWQAMDAGLGDVPVNVVAVDYGVSPPMMFAGTDRGLWRSDDLGVTFRRHGCGLPEGVVVNDLRVEADGAGGARLVVGTLGRGLWTVAVLDPADWDGNRVVNSTDVSDFINDWFTDQDAGTLVTDFNHDGVVNSTDVSELINAWFAAQAGQPYCP